MRRSLLLSLLLFLCAVPFVRAAMPGPGMPVPAPVVEVGEVLAVQDTRSRRYTGRVVSPATVSLVPRVAGEILEVGFREAIRSRPARCSTASIRCATRPR